MQRYFYLIIASLLFLSSCGPIIGGAMVAGNGVKDFQVVRGDLSSIRTGSHLAVLGPFATTESSFEICRGEEAAAFTNNFNKTGLFISELAMNNRLSETIPHSSDWRKSSPEEVQKALGLSNSPDLVMSATILSREMVPAPARGIIMKVGYRLDFLDLNSDQETSIEITVQQMFQDAVPASVQAFAQHLIQER